MQESFSILDKHPSLNPEVSEGAEQLSAQNPPVKLRSPKEIIAQRTSSYPEVQKALGEEEKLNGE